MAIPRADSFAMALAVVRSRSGPGGVVSTSGKLRVREGRKEFRQSVETPKPTFPIRAKRADQDQSILSEGRMKNRMVAKDPRIELRVRIRFLCQGESAKVPIEITVRACTATEAL